MFSHACISSFITCNYFLWSPQAPLVYSFDLDGASRDFEDHKLCQYLSSDIPSFQHFVGMYISYLEIALKSFPRLFFTSGLMDSCSCVLKNSEKVIMKIIFLNKDFLLINRVIFECANGNRN